MKKRDNFRHEKLTLKVKVRILHIADDQKQFVSKVIVDHRDPPQPWTL